MSRLFRTPSAGASADFLGGSQMQVIKAADAVKPPPPQVDRRRIFTFPSPPRRKINNVGDFLDACAYCRNQIHENHDRYMYGNLQAFCSIGCREKQIALDEIRNPPSPARAPSRNLFKRIVFNYKFKKLNNQYIM
ncbi:hypothetical protein C2S52_014731 [Perilla frutescens var. hirtella]|nr:hypothetical protein C2S52_014731 [Perilla frutescens var. hirtella]KAH6816414.1 hypothetical protein C2S51_021234 [Perilla frutescens var. frutescens]